jgi:DNA-binding response OmpR family regulator
MKLLVIDRDREVAEMLTGWLKMLGYHVRQTSSIDIEHAKVAWLEHKPDVVVVDPVYKDLDILTACCELRRQQDALLLVVTAEKDMKYEIRCLESGADDYLRKPFSPSQLLAHIHAVSRRARSTLQNPSPSVVTAGPISVDIHRNKATIQGKVVRLSPIERKLLHLLAIQANTVCTTEQIITHVWGYDGDGDARFIKTHIHHLRQKIEPDPSHPLFILTVTGIGYTLVTGKDHEQSAEQAHQTASLASENIS